MSVPLSTPFTRYSQQVTTRLRSRVHQQSFGHVVTARSVNRYSPAMRAALAQVGALVALRQEHRRTFDQTLRATAVKGLQELNLLSAEEDPHFTVTVRALRVASYFDAAQAPATLALLNHLTKHAYLLDGFALYQVCQSLIELRHPQSAEALQILLPRIRELAVDDFTAVETCTVLEALCTFEVGQTDTAVMERLARAMQRTIRDLPLVDVTRCLIALPCLPSRSHAKDVMRAAEPRLLELLEDARLHLGVYVAELVGETGASTEGTPGSGDIAATEKLQRDRREGQELVLTNLHESRALLRSLCRTATWLGWAPRRTMSELARAVLAYSAPRPVWSAVRQRTGASSSGEASGDVVFEEELKELDERWQGTPRMDHRDAAFFLRLLCLTSFRHERALKVLASRLATGYSDYNDGAASDTTQRAVADEAAAGRAQSAESTAMLDLTGAVEALAFFYVADAEPTVTALLSEVVRLRERGVSRFVGHHNMLIVVNSLNRLLASLSRLRYPLLAGGSAEKEVALVQTLLRDDALQWYASGPASARYLLLTAQLAGDIAQLAALLPSVTGTAAGTEDPVLRSYIMRLLALLLEAVARSPSVTGARPADTAGAAERAETQRSLTAAVEATTALLSLVQPTGGDAGAKGATVDESRRLQAALRGVEPLLLSLL